MTSPCPSLPLRATTAALCLQLLLTGCSATAQSVVWPQPAPPALPAPTFAAQPNFQAPSATHCARPIQTREVPGATHSQSGAMPTPRLRERSAKAMADDAAPAALALPSRTDRPVDRSSRAEAETGRLAAAPPSVASERRPYPTPQPAPQAPQQPSVTAGMVDDNASFADYLAFRERTQVAYRPRDVSERTLLEVRDAQGRAVPDAEVAVQSAQGYTMWARTDAAGKVWLHPNAFDPAHASVYDVTVRQGGRQAHTVLQRGQKSALEVRLGGSATTQRAKLDLVFLIDATGSMGDEIGKLKATLRTIANEVAQLPSRPDLCFGLVAYRDKGDKFLLRSHDLTNDLSAFQDVLNALQAGGGGDYPEAMNEALHDTVHQLSWRGNGTTRLVFLLADAPPHLDYGGPQYDDDMLPALGKGIKIFGVGASGLDKQGEYIQRQIAQYTGGRFVFLTYANASQPGCGPGRETVHDVKNYSVDTLDRLIFRLVREELAQLPAPDRAMGQQFRDPGLAGL